MPPPVHINTRPGSKVFYPVTYKKGVGALIANEESVSFYDDAQNGDKVVELDWQRVQKITANSATSSVALLRVTHTNGSTTTTFKFESRAELNKTKLVFKAFWKASHEMSMRNCDDEDFSESKKVEEDLIYQTSPPTLPTRTLPKANSERFARTNSSVRPRRASTSHLPRISGEGPIPAALTDSTNTSGSTEPKADIRLTDNQLLLKRQNSGHYRLDLTQFVKTQSESLPVSIIHANGEPGPSRILELEALLNNRDVEAQYNDEDYRISKRVFEASVAAAVCGVCVLLLMAAALVVLSVLLWDTNNNESGGGGDRNGLETDDFYSDYFQENPP